MILKSLQSKDKVSVAHLLVNHLEGISGEVMRKYTEYLMVLVNRNEQKDRT